MKTLNTLIKEWKFDYVNSDIEKHFTLEEARSKEYRLFHFDNFISSEDVIKEMTKEGFSPANITELLSWKDWNDKDWVVALGSVAKVSGNRSMPYLVRSDSVRKLSLGWFDVDWSGDFRFLAVRTQSLEPKSSALGTSDTLTLEARVEALEETVSNITKMINSKKSKNK